MRRLFKYSDILCECGCEEFPKEGNRYIHGHNGRKNKAIQLCDCNCRNYAKPGNKYINGHNREGKGKQVKKYKEIRNKIARFLWKNRNKYFCNCPCKRKIRLKKHHYYKGIPSIPKYICGHHSVEVKRPDTSKIMKGNKHFAGKKHTEEAKKKISAALSLDNPMHRPEVLFKKSGKNHHNWQGGISFEPYGVEFNKKLKYKIRKRDNFTCQKCNSKEQLFYTLHIHHIDYNKKNNKEENLISLCHSCHTKTNFNRENWVGYFKLLCGEQNA